MSADVARLEGAIRAAFARLAEEQGAGAARVLVRAAPIDAVATFAFPAEEALVARAVESRRRELATGRRLAHELLAELGAPSAPLLPGERRAPLWPAGVVGSISHAQGVAVVAIAPGPPFAALGLDVEGAEPLRPELVDVVLTARERRASDGPALGARAKLAFCAKECAYKAWSPSLARVPEFTEVEVELDAAGERFVAQPPVRSVSALRGACAIGADLVWAVALAPGPPFAR